MQRFVLEWRRSLRVCACVEVEEFICITYTTSVVHHTTRCINNAKWRASMCVNVFNTIKYSHNTRAANLHDANGRGGFARGGTATWAPAGTLFTCSASRYLLRSIHVRACVSVCAFVFRLNACPAPTGNTFMQICTFAPLLVELLTQSHTRWAGGVRSCVVQEFIVVAKQKTAALARTHALAQTQAHARLFVIYHFHYHSSGWAGAYSEGESNLNLQFIIIILFLLSSVVSCRRKH